MPIAAKRQTNGREGGEEPRLESALRAEVTELCVRGRDVRDSDGGQSPRYFPTNRRSERERVRHGAHDEIGPPVRRRKVRFDILCDGRALEPLTVHVPNYTDDLVRVRLVRRVYIQSL